MQNLCKTFKRLRLSTAHLEQQVMLFSMPQKLCPSLKPQSVLACVPKVQGPLLGEAAGVYIPLFSGRNVEVFRWLLYIL